LGCINANNGGGGCADIRCVRGYDPAVTGGGYSELDENTTAYSGDADNQTFFVLWDGQVLGGAANHIAYYAVQGGIVSNGTTNAPLGGDPYQANCAGDIPINCLELDDSRWPRTTPLASTNASYGGPLHTIRSIGGLSPVPNVRAGNPGLTGPIPLSWDAPDTFSGAMKGGPLGQPAPTSPVKGVRIYKCANQPCSGSGPLANDACWQPLASVDLPNTTTSDPSCPTAGSCNWYAATVRLLGPGGGAMEVETGREVVTNPPSSSGILKFVGVNSQAVACGATSILISSVNARYAGRGTVDVSWTTGIEGSLRGFYVSRGTSPSGPFSHVSPLIPQTGDASTYQFSDHAKSGVNRVIYYQVEAIGADGTVTASGPTAVTIPHPTKGSAQ
jgi:hypothetical protein